MKVTYDKKVDAGYIYIKDQIEKGEAKKTITVDSLLSDMINLDFNDEGVLIGIEIIPASKLLPKKLLDEAEIIDE